MMNMVGNNKCKKTNFIAEIVNALKVSKHNKSPKIRKTIDNKIVMNAIVQATKDVEKISQSFFDVVLIFYINSLLSILLEPILSAAENLALHISQFGISITSLFYIFKAIQSRIQS